MAITFKELGQARDNDTSTHSVYSPGAGVEAKFFVSLCNTTGSSALISVFKDDDGTIYDESTALLYEYPLDANGIMQLGPYMMNDSSGNLAYQQGTANAITITVDGVEIT